MASAASSAGVFGGGGGVVGVGAGVGGVVTALPGAPGAPPRLAPPPARAAVGTPRPKMAFLAIRRSTIGLRCVPCCAAIDSPKTAVDNNPSVTRAFIKTPVMLPFILFGYLLLVIGYLRACLSS